MTSCYVTVVLTISVLTLVLILTSDAQSPGTRKFALSVQGKDRCPNPDDGAMIVSSELECAKMCTSSQDCLHYAYRNSERSCSLHFSTPGPLYNEEGCALMMDFSAYCGCFSEVSVRMDPFGCDFPFQFNNRMFNGCMSLNSTLLCVSNNGTLVDCIVPPDFTAKQGVVINTADFQPLPCLSNWIIYMLRQNGSIDFLRNWTDYRQGFGDSTEFWTGNEIIHTITTQPGVTYKLRVELYTLTGKKWYFAEYSTFSLGTETEFYTLHLSGFTGNAGDSLADPKRDVYHCHNGLKFSTPDSDNDLKPDGPCTSIYKGSFWFGNCYWTCLTCLYTSKDFNWYSLHELGYEYYGKLGAARMMIRIQ